jgi:hypothetical protein
MRIALASLSMLALSGCATITTGQNQPVSVETPGCAGATCKLSNDKGTWYVSATPGSATVQRAYSDMMVTCEKGDYRSNPYPIRSSTKAMAFGNIVFGGLIGAAVDAGSGAAYDYPTLITVLMVCSGDPATVVQPTAPKQEPPPGTVTATDTTATPSTASATAASATAISTPAPMPEKTIPVSVVKPVSLTPQPLAASKHMFAAERLAKSLGCEQPVSTMNIQTSTSETFTVRCTSHDPLAIRCDGSECHELK